MQDYSKKSQDVGSTRRRSLPEEIVLTVIAFLAWGVAAPGTWIAALSDNKMVTVVVPVAIGVFAAAALGLRAGTALTQKRT